MYMYMYMYMYMSCTCTCERNYMWFRADGHQNSLLTIQPLPPDHISHTRKWPSTVGTHECVHASRAWLCVVAEA